jgi:HK97 family phage portal protein
MRSAARAIIDRFSNRIESATGWSNTTYDRTNPFLKSSSGKGTKEMEIYGAVSTLFAVVSKISNSCGSVAWNMSKPKVDGRQVYGERAEDNKPVLRHVALDLWSKPNPFYPGSLFVEASQQHIDLTGECFWVVARNRLAAMPLELWIVRPDKMTEVPDDEEFLRGWIYSGPNGEKIPLEAADVIQVKMPNPLDPYRGLGPVQALMVDLGATAAAGEYNRNFFKNDASPGGVIEMDVRMSDSEWQEFNDRWRFSHQGVSNAHRVAMLENGAKWKDVAFSMRDMQFTELRNQSRDMILEAFGMSPHMIGRVEDINRANAEAAEDTYARWVLKPRLDRLKDALNHQLLPLFGSSGQGLEFNFEDPSLEDSEANNNALVAKSTAAKTLIEAGGKFESVLEAVGLPEIEFDQEKVDREEASKKAQAEALKQAQPGQPPSGEAPSKNGSEPKKKEAVPV